MTTQLGFLLDYLYFKEQFKMTEIDLSKQQAIDADPKAIQQTSFTWNLDQAGNTIIFSLLDMTKFICVLFIGSARIMYIDLQSELAKVKSQFL